MENELYVENMIKHSKEIQNILNDFFITEFIKSHNINPSHNKMKVKQEIVFDKCYFLDGKKKYALHKINDNGVDCDDIEIKGLEIRRSDFSQKTKEYLMMVINKLLSPNKLSIVEIMNFIKKIENEILKDIKSRKREIGRPVTFNSKIEEYKVVPSHINGMLMWNDLEYKIFEPGTKGYLFNILGIDEIKAPKHVYDIYKEKYSNKKYNNIVVPYEEDEVPEYYIIDVDKMISFSWKDRISLLISPILEKESLYDDNSLTW